MTLVSSIPTYIYKPYNDSLYTLIINMFTSSGYHFTDVNSYYRQNYIMLLMSILKSGEGGDFPW